MRLWHKIFLGTVSLFLIGFLIFAPSIVQRNFKNSLERERERCTNEMGMQISRIEDRLNMGEEEGEAVTDIFKKSKNGGWTHDAGYLYLEDGICLYNGSVLEEEDVKSIAKEESCLILLGQKNDRHYMIVRHDLGEKGMLVYCRDVERLYENRKENIREIILWSILMLAAMSLMAYWMARWVTNPLERMEENVGKLNRGEVCTPLKEGKDELGKLGAAYNSMSAAVLEREEELRMAAMERQRFIEAMSHELNTPLTSIQGYAQLLQNANCTQEQKMLALQNIQTETRRMQQMQKKLMEIHSIRKENLVKEKVDMVRLVAEVEEELKGLIKGKNITVIERVEQKEMTGDKTLLHILLSNFLRNSITYSESGQIVEIFVYQGEGNQQCLQVKDYGCGIPKDQIKKVTKAFYRVDKSRSRATGGAGIGLYLCNHIVEMMHGELKMFSKEGQGTTITIIF